MATYYVRATGGNDANDGLSFANGWATLQKALDALLGGDTLYMCATSGSPFTVTATVDVDMNAGGNASAAVTAPIYVRGADLTTGAAYAGVSQAKITTATAGLTNGLFLASAAADYFKWFDLLFDGGGSGKASYGIFNTASSVDGWEINNCRFTNCSSHGCMMRGAVPIFALNCRFDSNGKGGTGSGFASQASGAGYLVAHGCSFDHNATHGVAPQSTCRLHNCKVYRNGADGVGGTTSGTGLIMTNCTVYLNTGDGVDMSALNVAGPELVNNTFVNNGGYGINFNGRDVDAVVLMAYNHTHNNTAGVTDINSGVLPGTGNQTGDPLFTSTTDNSENFAPLTGSPLINNGLLGGVIGALERSVDYPAVGNVTQDDTVDGVAGTFVAPGVGDVRSGTTYGAGGTEYTGTLVAGGGAVDLPEPLVIGA